jgi:hypothetical protein
MSIATRRDFLKTLGAAAALSASSLKASIPVGPSTAGLPATEFFPNRQPLGKGAFYPLPLTSVRPKGWLLKQLQIQAGGLGGHLDEFWPDVGPDSGWLGGSGESWERGPYFLDGLVPLAYLLNDAGLVAKSQKWLDWTLENQQANGMFGPTKNDDWWQTRA